MHRCPTEGCKREVDDSQLMCKQHWYMLSREDRAMVYDSFRSNGPGADHIRTIEPALNRLNKLIRMRNTESGL